MELEGVVHNGVIVPDDATELPEGTRVTIQPVAPIGQRPKTFRERYGDLIVNDPSAPTDLAEQHDHYRLGTPKR
jgi:hypothetical protein